MFIRLSVVDPELVTWLGRRSREELRQSAAGAARLAVERTGIADPRLDAALIALVNAQCGDMPEQAGAEELAGELDVIAWDIQDEAESEASAPNEPYVTAFRRARAASSVSFALGPNPLAAALEATYEAHAATHDLDAVRAAIGWAPSKLSTRVRITDLRALPCQGVDLLALVALKGRRPGAQSGLTPSTPLDLPPRHRPGGPCPRAQESCVLGTG